MHRRQKQNKANKPKKICFIGDLMLSMMCEQRVAIEQSLIYPIRRDAIMCYCRNLRKKWYELSYTEASSLINKLVEMSWA
jgi:hypothetical protein